MNTKKWFVDSNGDVCVSEGVRVASVMQSNYTDLRDDANLIAAAPELLAALEKMTYLADDSGKFLQLQDFIETAQAVIAKAKGEEVKDDTINPPYAVVPPIDTDKKEKCDCCESAEKYNGLGSGPILFHCPKNCWCHD